MPRIEFSKYEGLGNDFIVVDQEVSERAAMALCDRHRGIGADGVLMVKRAGDVLSMRVINADGSVPEMCGNGLRCVVLHFARTGGAAMPRAFEVTTDAGPHACRVLELGETGVVEVMMRPASLVPREIGLTSDKALIDTPIDIGEELIDVDIEPLRVTAVSMGNPHAVTFDDLTDMQLKKLGPQIEKHPLFERGANAGFAKMTGARSMNLRVYERGVGWTEACGTGACAAVVAAIETSRAQRGEPIDVRLPGGVLTITVGAREERVRMTGPARHVYDGTIELP